MTTNRPIRSFTKSTEKFHLKDPRWPCSGCVHDICTRYEPHYEIGSLRSGNDHLYNPSKPIPIPQIQADPIPQIQVAGNPKENRLQFLRRELATPTALQWTITIAWSWSVLAASKSPSESFCNDTCHGSLSRYYINLPGSLSAYPSPSLAVISYSKRTMPLGSGQYH